MPVSRRKKSSWPKPLPRAWRATTRRKRPRWWSVCATVSAQWAESSRPLRTSRESWLTWRLGPRRRKVRVSTCWWTSRWHVRVCCLWWEICVKVCRWAVSRCSPTIPSTSRTHGSRVTHPIWITATTWWPSTSPTWTWIIQVSPTRSIELDEKSLPKLHLPTSTASRSPRFPTPTRRTPLGPRSSRRWRSSCPNTPVSSIRGSSRNCRRSASSRHIAYRSCRRSAISWRETPGSHWDRQLDFWQLATSCPAWRSECSRAPNTSDTSPAPITRLNRKFRFLITKLLVNILSSTFSDGVNRYCIIWHCIYCQSSERER